MIGLSGGIGSGKSTVAAVWKEHGATIIDADQVARDVVEPGEPALQEIAQEFGEDVLLADGSLDRGLLAQRAFASEARTERLNTIMKPYIRGRVAKLAAESPQPELTVYDVPLLIEHNLEGDLSTIVMVLADEDRRVERLQRDRGMSESDVRNRIQRQATDAQRRAVADIVIENNGTVEELRREALRVWNYLVANCSST
ncbi:MAG TPA: dephospho-CoA kinase [Corynebacteriales bacterium]|nr:dephospho-CoA kinase [Mycobacteriales bacterium]